MANQKSEIKAGSLVEELEGTYKRIEYLENANKSILAWLERFESLSGIFRELSPSLDVHSILDNMVIEMKKLMDWSKCAIFLVNHDTSEFELRYLDPPDEDAMWQKEFERQVDEGNFAWVLDHGHPSYIDTLYMPYTRQTNSRENLILVPLVTFSRVLGMIFLLAGLEEGEVQTEIMRLLLVLSRQFSYALDNSLLIHELKNSQEEVEQYSQTLEQKVAERTDELKRLILKLEDMNKMKDEFLAMVSHELRTPLTSIKAFAEELLECVDTADTRTLKEFLGIINEESERLTRLINDFLDLRKIESGTIEYQKGPFDINEVLLQVVMAFDGIAEKRGIEIIQNFSGGLPIIYADFDRMIQVFTNLIDNSIKYNHDGGKVWIRSRLEDKDNVGICIKDTGIGIAADQLDKIFEKFHKVDSIATKKAGGTGLGLAIVKSIVKAHDGDIKVESTPGKGSEFVVTLPCLSNT